MSESDSDTESDRVLQLKLEAIKVQQERVNVELEIAEREKKRKRKRLVDEDQENAPEGPRPPKKKKKKKKSHAVEPSPSPSPSPTSHSPSPLLSTSRPASITSKTSSKAYPEKLKGVKFKHPPHGMIVDRPQTQSNRTYECSPWALEDDTDGWNLFLRYVRECVPKYFNTSKGWRDQGRDEKNAFLAAVKARYPILAHQLTQFTATAAASRHLRNESKKPASSKSSSSSGTKTASKPRGQGKKKKPEQAADAPPQSSDDDIVDSLRFSPTTGVQDHPPSTADDLVLPPEIDPALLTENAAAAYWNTASSAANQPAIYSAGGILFATPEMPASAPAARTEPAPLQDPVSTQLTSRNHTAGQNRSRREMPFVVDAQLTLPSVTTNPTNLPIATASVIKTATDAPSSTSAPSLSSSTLVPVAPSAPVFLSPASDSLVQPSKAPAIKKTPAKKNSAVRRTPNVSTGRNKTNKNTAAVVPARRSERGTKSRAT